MIFPFDEWCQPGGGTDGVLHQRSCFSDLTLVYSGFPVNAAAPQRPRTTLGWATRPFYDGPSHTIQPPTDRTLDLHRIILSQACPSYFGVLLRAAPNHVNEKSLTGTQACDVRWVREDRLAPEVCDVGVPSVLRYLYSGVLGVSTPRSHEPDGTNCDITPLSIEDVCAVLIVATCWGCGSERHDERLTALVSYLFEHLLSLCDAATAQSLPLADDDVQCTRESMDFVAQSQVPTTLPSPRNGPSHPQCSRQELARTFMKMVTTIDALANAQKQCNARLRSQQLARQHNGTNNDEHHLVRTSSCFVLVELFPEGSSDGVVREPFEMTLATAARLQSDAREALSQRNTDGSGGLTTVQLVIGSLWCRARESLVAVTVDSLGSELMVSVLPELPAASSSADWDSCVVHICRDCETVIADQPSTVAPTDPASSHELVKFTTEPSLVADVFGIASWLDAGAMLTGETNLFCGASFRCIAWILWRWSAILRGAVDETAAARRELLAKVCEVYKLGLPSEEFLVSLLSQTLGGGDDRPPSIYVDESMEVLIQLARTCRLHDVLRLQLASLSRIAAALITSLRDASLTLEAGGGGGLSVAECYFVKDELLGAIPRRFSASPGDLPHSLWHALSFTIRSTSGRMAVRCSPAGDAQLIPLSPLDAASVKPMVLWATAVALRDEALVRWMLQEYFAALGDAALMTATQLHSSTAAPTLWAALSHASATINTTAQQQGHSRKRARTTSLPLTADTAANVEAPSIESVGNDVDAPEAMHGSAAAENQESVPLFATLGGRDVMTALTPAAHFTNPNSLFPTTIVDVPSRRSWEDVLADDTSKLATWMNSVTDLCDKLLLRDHSGHNVGEVRPPAESVSTGDSIATDDDGSTQRPTLLTGNDESHVRQSALQLRSYLDESRRVRDAHAENIRVALHTLLTDELRDAQQALCSLTTATLKPAIDEVRALEAARSSAQQEMSVLQMHVHDLSHKLESVQHECTSQLDVARSQISQYRSLVEKQDMRASRIMDSLDTQVLPALEARRGEVLAKMLETVTSAVSTLQDRGK